MLGLQKQSLYLHLNRLILAEKEIWQAICNRHFHRIGISRMDPFDCGFSLSL